MAAQGALPLKPADLVELLHHLLGDREAACGGRGRTALGGISRRRAAADPEGPRDAPARAGLGPRPPRGARAARGRPAERLAAGRDDRELAPGLPAELAELVVINQVRLLRRTTLLEALESNPNLNNDQRRRLRELRETLPHRRGSPEPPPPEAAPPSPRPCSPRRRSPSPRGGRRGSPSARTRRWSATSRKTNGARRRRSAPCSGCIRLNTADKVIDGPQGQPRGAGHPRSRPQPSRGDRGPRQPAFDRARDRVVRRHEERLGRDPAPDRDPQGLDQALQRGGEPGAEPAHAPGGLPGHGPPPEPAGHKEHLRRPQRARTSSASRPNAS